MAQVFGPLTLPKSGKEVFFREPTGGDRLDVLKQNPIGTDDVMSGNALLDLYLAAKCIEKVDGKDVNKGDYKHLFDGWPNVDATYYQQIFTKMFTLDDKTFEKMDSVVDFLLNGSGSTVSSS